MTGFSKQSTQFTPFGADPHRSLAHAGAVGYQRRQARAAGAHGAAPTFDR